MLSANEILKNYYDDADEEVFPEFYTSENSDAELIPGYENEYTVYSIHKAKPEYAEKLAEDGYDIVYRIIGQGRDFIGMIINNLLYDVTDDILNLLEEDNDDEDDTNYNPGYRGDNFMSDLKHGEALYQAYGPNVDPNDLDEDDAECYLAYKRVFEK